MKLVTVQKDTAKAMRAVLPATCPLLIRRSRQICRPFRTKSPTWLLNRSSRTPPSTDWCSAGGSRPMTMASRASRVAATTHRSSGHIVQSRVARPRSHPPVTVANLRSESHSMGIRKSKEVPHSRPQETQHAHYRNLRETKGTSKGQGMRLPRSPTNLSATWE